MLLDYTLEHIVFLLVIKIQMRLTTSIIMYWSSTFAYRIKIQHIWPQNVLSWSNEPYAKEISETQSHKVPDLEQITTLSPAFRNSLARAYPIPDLKLRGKPERIGTEKGI